MEQAGGPFKDAVDLGGKTRETRVEGKFTGSHGLGSRPGRGKMQAPLHLQQVGGSSSPDHGVAGYQDLLAPGRLMAGPEPQQGRQDRVKRGNSAKLVMLSMDSSPPHRLRAARPRPIRSDGESFSLGLRLRQPGCLARSKTRGFASHPHGWFAVIGLRMQGPVPK